MTATVIIPTRNGVGRIGQLLDSLDDEAEVIVVDNASNDGTRELLERRYTYVTSLRLSSNEGFSRAVNHAARLASGDVLVLLNDDCVCENGFVARIEDAIDASSATVMAAAVMLEVREPTRIDSAGIELDETLLVFDYLNGMHVSVLETNPVPPLGPSGAASGFHREAFLDAGGFDEHLFAYWEDVDLALRLRSAGAKCTLVSNARATHAHSSTLGSGSAEKNYLTGFGRGYLLRKWRLADGVGAPVVAARDAAICLAQLAIDRNLAGVRGRIDGWRAARDVDPLDLPGDLLPRRGILAEVSRRGQRRFRLGERPT